MKLPLLSPITPLGKIHPKIIMKKTTYYKLYQKSISPYDHNSVISTTMLKPHSSHKTEQHNSSVKFKNSCIPSKGKKKLFNPSITVIADQTIIHTNKVARTVYNSIAVIQSIINS